MFNFSYRKVGGLRFFKLGRVTLMFCISAEYRPIRQVNRPRVRQIGTTRVTW